jgi:uncharacterized protein (TIGR02594 family)
MRRFRRIDNDPAQVHNPLQGESMRLSTRGGIEIMANDPADYAWLDKLGTLPRMVVEARNLVGVQEKPGSVNNPVIMSWAKEVAIDIGNAYTSDEVAWCGLFMAVVARRAGKTPPAKPLWALNWRKFGEDGGQPELGDVLVFMRPTATGMAGHVGLYIGEDAGAYHVLGGNQDNRVCYARKEKDRVCAVRQPPYMQRPTSAQPYFLDERGRLAKKKTLAALAVAGGSEA